MSAMDAAGLTDVGKKRKKNEDSFKALVPPEDAPESQYGSLFMVADGMGGVGGGDVASQSAVSEVSRRYYDAQARQPNAQTRLAAALEAANAYLREQASKIGRERIGSTIAGLLVASETEGLVFNVGDSRVYRIRQGQIERISQDQSVMARQIESGMVSEEEARAARNNNLTQFLGQPGTVEPILRKVTLQEGDTFILCSDGLWSLVNDLELLNAVSKVSAQEACKKLVGMALKRGAPDNVTVVVVRIGAQVSRGGRGILLLALAALAALVVLGLAAVALASQNAAPPVSTAALASSSSTPAALAASETPSDVLLIPPSTAEPDFAFTPISPTPSQTPSVTNTAAPTRTPSPTLTLRPSSTPTSTPTPTPTFTLTFTPRPTGTPTPEPTNTPTVAPEDRDGDGFADDSDQCPDTSGAVVGCPFEELRAASSRFVLQPITLNNSNQMELGTILDGACRSFDPGGYHMLTESGIYVVPGGERMGEVAPFADVHFAFSADGRWAFLGGVGVIDLRAGQTSFPLLDPSLTAAFSHNSDVVAVPGQGILALSDFSSSLPIEDTGEPMTLTFSPDDRFLAVSGVGIYDRQSLSLVVDDPVAGVVVFDPGARYAAVQNVGVYDLSAGQMFLFKLGEGEPVFSPDGRWLAVQGDGVYAVETWTPVFTLSGSGPVAFSPDSQYLAVDLDAVYDVATGQVAFAPEDPEARVLFLDESSAFVSQTGVFDLPDWHLAVTAPVDIEAVQQGNQLISLERTLLDRATHARRNVPFTAFAIQVNDEVIAVNAGDQCHLYYIHPSGFAPRGDAIQPTAAVPTVTMLAATTAPTSAAPQPNLPAPTGAPQATSLPATAAPPTAVPPTAVPPTDVPPTDVPPTDVPPPVPTDPPEVTSEAPGGGSNESG